MAFMKGKNCKRALLRIVPEATECIALRRFLAIMPWLPPVEHIFPDKDKTFAFYFFLLFPYLPLP